MRTEFIYSVIALGAVPVVMNAADVKSLDVIQSANGSQIVVNVGKLVPGSYTFKAQLTSKVYGVKVKIAGKEVDGTFTGNNTAVSFDFNLDKETDVNLELVSTDPDAAGAGFTFAESMVILNFDLAKAKKEWADAIDLLKTKNIPAYDYDNDDEKADAKDAVDLLAELNKIEDTYEAYVAQKLYQDASVPQGKIDALAAKIASHQNTQAYNNVNAAITAYKAKYNTAVANVKDALVDQAAYLLEAALKDLDDNINKKITEATQASYASSQAGTAVADETKNKDKIPTEDALNAIVKTWTDKGATTQAAYDALQKKVTDQQAALDAAVPEESVASLFPKTDAQAAIDALNTKIEGVANSAAQETVDVSKEEKAASDAVTAYAAKVGKANAEYKANEATVAAIKTLQDNLDAAKAAVNALKSTDGKYEAKNYYDAYVTAVQKEIDDLSAAAAKAYKADGTGSAVDYNKSLNTATIQSEINTYGGTTEPAVDGMPKQAVDKYNALQTAIDGVDAEHPGYQGQLDAARAQVVDFAVYNDDTYDYQTKFDLIQKRINDINKAIKAAKEKVGAEHWTAMLAIDADAEITSDIAKLLTNVQSDQNKYDADYLANGITELEGKITAFKAKDASVLGADVDKFKAVENGIETAYNAVKDAKAKVAADGKSVDLTAKVGTSQASWHGSGTYGELVELFGNTAVGVKLYQDVAVEDGIYDIIVKATSHNAHSGNYMTPTEDSPVPALQEDADDVAYVFGKGENEVKTWITARKNSNMAEGEPGTYEIKGVNVKDGKLTIGLALDKKGQTEWHTIQIVSLKGGESVVSKYIQSLGQEVAKLKAQQEALEAATEPVAAKVTENAKAKTDLAKNIDNLQAKIVKFVDTYKIGDDANTTLGNRGKADGSVTKEVAEIEKALGDLETTNNGFDPTVVTDVDKTSSVNKHKADDGWTTELKKTGNFRDWTVANIEAVEHWVSSDDNAETGVVFTQTVKNLANGLYDVVLYANAVDQKTAGKNGGAYVYANGVTKDVTVTENATDGEGKYTLKNVVVSDGTLKIGMVKTAAGTNWHSIQIKSLTYRENNQLSTYNNTDAEKPGYNTQYTALSNQEAALEKAAPGIVTAVKNNATANTAALKALTDLGTYESNNLKSLADVSGEDGNYSTSVAKKTDPNPWYVFKSDLDADKTYEAKKAAIDATITDLTGAINDANAAETLPYPWADEITVTTEDDPATADVNEASSTTYKISEIKATIDALKAEAADESANFWAYRNTNKSNVKAVTDAITAEKEDLATSTGAGAFDYYTGVLDGYEAEKQAIYDDMLASLKARTAVSKKDGWIADLKTLRENKVKQVKKNAKANLEKYTEQVKAYQETQTLWNSTYTEIAATDKSSKVQDWLDELDAIQVTLTEATKAVEDNYKVGKSVAEAKDFATIQAAINDVKARQSAAYSAQITADNQAAHESFMGYDKEDGTHVDGTIEQATKAYQTAVRARAQYSSTNEDIKKAVDAAAATLDKALFSAPTDIAALTEKENKAYAETQSPTVFNVSTYNADALTIEQKITNALDDFKTAVKTAINGVWSPKKGDKTTVDTYAYKLDQAETAIDGYSKDAKTDAFKNVKDLIAQGDAGVKFMTLSKVEDAINALDDSENGIDAMLAADKDAAAVKDITAASAAASAAYSDAKSYIDGKTIADDYNNVKQTQLDNLEAAKTAADNVLETYTEDKWEYATHDAIAPALTNVVKVATAAKKAVDTAVESDVKNTEAYNEMVKVIEPVEAKLAEAETVAAPYKYAASFDTDETTLANIKAAAGAYKSTGTAVSEANKTDIKNRVATLSTAIETTMTNAFDDEKTGLTADITELKNQFNAYVADNGLNETANGYLADINALEKRRSEAAIKDLAITKEKPEGDGIDFEDIKAATNDLIKVQDDIANKETEMLAANSSTANAKVLADFNNQIGELEKTASLEGYDSWVGQQKLNGKTLEEQITALKAQIAEVQTAVNAEPNIAFYKDQYQKKIDAIKTALKPVADEIAAKDAQFKANAAAYERLTAEINELQKAIDNAKVKVGGYDYVGPDKLSDYTDLIEVHDEDGELVGGAKYKLNLVKNYVDKQNINKTVHQIPEATISEYKTDISNSVQNYLDNSANDEIQGQRDNLDVLLTAAIDVKNHEKVQKYSSALWKRLADEKNSIYNEIVDLAKDIYYSGTDEEGSFDVKTDYEADVYIGISKTDGWATYYYQWDEEKNMPKAKTITCNTDFDDQMKTVNAIKAKIESLSIAVKNLQLLGDANVDGKVNVLDYQLVTNMILDPRLQPNPESEDQTQADLFANIDINQSTVIEVGDLTAIVNYILKGSWQGYAAARSFNRGDNENLSLDYSSVNSDVQRIAVNLENANDYTAFQMDVVLPDGMKIVGTSLSSRAGESHKLYSREQLDGSTRILVSSITGETFSGNEGAVLYIDVEGAKASSVEILNILFSDVNANTRAFKLGNNVTGIDAIGSTFDALKQKVYDLGGRVMNGVKKGINIIRNADGSTRKVAE